MCWSAEVAGTFAAVEFLVLVYLFWRNKLFDRENVLFHVPILLQEALQAFLWPHVEKTRQAALGWSDPAVHTCSRANTRLSFGIFFFVAGTAPFWCGLVIRRFRQHDLRLERSDAPEWARLVGRTPAVFLRDLPNIFQYRLLCHALLSIGLAYLYFWAPPTTASWVARCTSRGPFGHQVWSVCTWPNMLVEVVVFLCYARVSGPFNLLMQPTILPALFLPLNTLVICLFLLIGAEAGSIWCWGASTFCFAYVIEPALLQWANVFDPAHLAGNAEGEELRARPALVWSDDPLPTRLAALGRHLVFTAVWRRFKFGKGPGRLPWRPRDASSEELVPRMGPHDGAHGSSSP